MVEYKLETQTILKNESKSLITYGISAFEDGRFVLTVSDISTDKTDIERLIEKFNTYDLSLCHLNQAIEDYLYDLNVD